MTQPQSDLLKWFLLFLLGTIWGSSFWLMKHGLETYTYQQAGALRISFAFIVFLPFIFSRIKRVKRQNWIFLLLVGVIGNGTPAFLFTKAQTEIPSATAGILNALTPIFTLLIALAIYRTKIKFLSIIGIIMGLIGALIIISGGNFFTALFSTNIFGVFIVIATLFYGISINITKNNLKQLDSLTIACIAFLFIGPIAITYLFTTDFTTRLTTMPHAYISLSYFAVLGIVGSATALVLFNYLIKITSSIFASSVTYIAPIIALTWGLSDGEKISWPEIIGVLIIFTGIYLVNNKRQ